MKIFIKKSSCFDIVDSVTFYRDHRIEKSACLSLKCFPNALLLRACLPQDSGHRTLENFEIEFLDSKERNQFLEYLKRNRFFLEKQRKKFLVLINPVSGKGKAKGIKYYTYYIHMLYLLWAIQDIWGQVYEMLSGVERDFEIVITERAGQAMEMTRDLDTSRCVLASLEMKDHVGLLVLSTHTSYFMS